MNNDSICSSVSSFFFILMARLTAAQTLGIAGFAAGAVEAELILETVRLDSGYV